MSAQNVAVEPDPRPRIVIRDGVAFVDGTCCVRCGYPAAAPSPRCARCAAPIRQTYFGPEGSVWSWTVVRIGSRGRATPYPLAYVDLSAGPRIVAEVEGERPPMVGARVRLVGSSPVGNPIVAVIA